MSENNMAPMTPDKKPKGFKGVLIVGLAVIAAAVGITTMTRINADAKVASWTKEQAEPTVTIIKPTASKAHSLVLPARLQALSEALVYARTSGYLRSWEVDIGTRVKQGQVLAEIDTPEVDHQLAAAEAALSKVLAERQLAKLTSSRQDELIKMNATSKQIVDVDIAAEQTKYVSAQVLTETAIAALSQANDMKTSLLSLVK